jgi:sialate O-acetylesterase
LNITGSNSYQQPLAGPWKFHILLPELEAYKLNQNQFPALVYNAMIHPFTHYAIKGVAWYQGESNITWAEHYKVTFPALIRDWRKLWGVENLPFHFVQLPAYGAGCHSNPGCDWAELREAQASALSLPNTYMTVTVDLGERDNIHPNDKKEVGKRLAASILANSYQKNIAWSGPYFEKMELQNGNAQVFFTNTGAGLMAKDGKPQHLNGFEMAGADRQFLPAEARLEGGGVLVSCPQVPAPVALRYAWTGYPEARLNLYGQNGFPVAPFRTDDWPGTTQGKVYRPKFFPTE